MHVHPERQGLIQVYTGNGKGKTTASLGLALRAAGKHHHVFIIQFMKGQINYGELEAVCHVPGICLEQFGRPDFVSKEHPAKIDIDLAHDGLGRAKEVIASGDWDLVILDELNVALDFKLVPLSEVIELINKRPKHVEIVITGRYAPDAILATADLITEMKEIKHPYSLGVPAREGIEF